MNKIKYSEIFYSFQGEGRYIGVPSVFLRTFGCNFECPGFGQPSGQLMPQAEMPHNTFDVSGIKEISELPVVNIGCDSSASWSKKYKHLAKTATVEELAKELAIRLPFNTGIDYNHRKGPHLVITGGEPLLGWQKFYPELFKNILFGQYFNYLTFETNGTRAVDEKLSLALTFDPAISEVTWSVSPKLSNSGESFEDAIKPEALKTMNGVCGSYLYLKFVVRNKEQLGEIQEAISIYKSEGVKIDRVYLMPEGATQEGLALTTQEVAQMCLDNGYSFSPRLHVDVFGNKWGT